MNYTENYQLNQWVESDRVLMKDFNADNTKIDAALGELMEAISNHSAVLGKLKNCQIYMRKYVGTGLFTESNPMSLSFPAVPALLVITGFNSWLVHIPGQSTSPAWHGNAFENLAITWSGSTARWYSPSGSIAHLNEQGQTYCALAFYLTN